MAEIIMTFALGFLIASGIGLALAVPLWRRAVDITQKRLHASSPVSLDDFNADKDRMRAEFAMSARKLEMSVENLRKKAETRLAELDKRERQVAALNEQIEEKSGLTAKQGEEIAILKQQLSDAESSLQRRTSELGELRTRLTEAQNVLARQAVAIREANSLVEGHRDEIEVLSRSVDANAEELAKKAAAVEERDVQLAKCGRAVAEQKMLVGELRRERTQLAQQITQIGQERDAAVRVSAEASQRETRIAGERDETRAALDAARAEIAELTAKAGELTRDYAERSEWERRESALLKERLGDLAVEVERASSDIDAMLGMSGESVAQSSRARARDLEADHAGAHAPLSLAERIRALSGISAH